MADSKTTTPATDDKAIAEENKKIDAALTAQDNAGLDSDVHPVATNEGDLKEVDALGRDTRGRATAGMPDLGEQLAAKAVEERDNGGNTGTLRQVFTDPQTGKEQDKEDENSVRNFVVDPNTDQSDNGKVYEDPRIIPSDTNAPDAGLTPDGRRIAK